MTLTQQALSFSAGEREDIGLLPGPGMLAAGWHARTVNAPGAFLVAAEHDAPQRARAYVATGQAVASTTAMHADFPPQLHATSRREGVQDPRSGDAHPERDVPSPAGQAEKHPNWS